MKTALLVIDYIKGIIETGSCKDYAENHPIIDNVNRLIDALRKTDQPIYFIRLAFDKNYTHCPKHSTMFTYVRENDLFQLGNTDTEFLPELHMNDSDIIINKTSVSPFTNTELEKQLQSQGIEHLIFTGVATDNAINLGTREAHDRGYFTTVVEDTCGASTEEAHTTTLGLLEKIANEIVSTDQALKST